MSKTATHSTRGQDSALATINALSVLDLHGLSFVQLRRLHKVLKQACGDVDAETKRRADADNSGDTVRVQSPDL